MAGSNSSQAASKKSWLHELVWTVLVFLWVSVVIPFAQNIISSAVWVPDGVKQKITNFSHWIFTNIPFFIACIVILALLTTIAFLVRNRISQENTPPILTSVNSPSLSLSSATSPATLPFPQNPIGPETCEKYLRILLQKTMSLNLEGIPTPYRLPNVLLEEVFIPLEFLPRRLDSDYEITKEEGQHYLELEQKEMVPEDLERIFIDKEHRLLDRLNDEKRITISDLWQRMDSRRSVLVIQGYPGMGKSTLLARLTLHLARLNLAQPDALMQQSLAVYGPAPLPIQLILKDYATEYKKACDSAKSLSVSDYLLLTSSKIAVPELFTFFKESLERGRCLILFDGVDEISDLAIRRSIRDEIEHFIDEYSAIPSGPTFNRFLITSRVAGYEVVVFQHYQHVTVAELTEKQITDFLPRWCRANLPAPELVGQDKYTALLQEADLTSQRVMDAIVASSGARKLADNPLLLTLLVVLQQNRIELPRQRYKLYSAITTMMLENRNADKLLPIVEEEQAIERLGPISYTMQAQNNSFASKRDVNNSLARTLEEEGSGATLTEVNTEVKTFLSRIRERSGLFVIRTGDYYGFFHRTFQEYFASRYILNQVKRDPTTWIATFVEHARRSDDLWREPFLLAVAYQSNEDKTIAQALITALLDHPRQDNEQQQAHDLLLAAESLLEAKPLGRSLETRIATQLLQMYKRSLHTREHEICKRIESVVSRLLLNLSDEAFHPALLDVLYTTICATQQPSAQRSTLILLTMIVQSLTKGPNLIFTKIVPPLLSLAGLPAVGKYNPDPSVAFSINLEIADLALTTLTFMDKRGPAGVLLLEVRQFFQQDHPELLCQLAHFSLQAVTLITPAVVPLHSENYQWYETAVEQWLSLKQRYDIKKIMPEDIDACVTILNALLDAAQEAAYLSTIYIQQMLQASAQQPDKWQSIWQDYLLSQLNNGHYVDYRQCALLWATFFPSKQAQHPLANAIINHMHHNTGPMHHYALRFISSLCEDLRDLRDLRYPRYLRYLRDLRYLRYLRELSDLRNLGYLRELKALRYLRDLRDSNNLRELNELKYLRELRETRYLRDLRELGNLRDLIFTNSISMRCIALLSISTVASAEEKSIDLLTILLGRLLYIIEVSIVADDIEQETRQIVQAAIPFLAPTNSQETAAVALDILCSIPTRTASEISFVLQQAEHAKEPLQSAYVRSLRYVQPHDASAWNALDQGTSSPVQAIKETIKTALKNKK